MGTPRASTAAVFLREARRTSRRWQTYALRVAVAAGLFLVVGAVFGGASGRIDPARGAEMGRTLFQVYTAVQMGVVGVLAPLLVGLGVAEERDEGTLQLLVITRLGPGQILWGKVVSRLLVLATFVVGGLPVLALLSTFGGVSGWEVVNATANTLLVAGVLGLLGGIAALSTGSGIASVLFAGAWAFAAYLVLPGLFTVATTADPGRMVPVLCPPWAMYEPSWRGLLPIVAHLPAAWFAAWFATPLFSLVTTRDDLDLDADPVGDPDLARVVRGQRRIGVAGLVVLPWLGVVVWMVTSGHRATQVLRLGDVPLSVDALGFRIGAAYAVAVLLLVVGTGALILLQIRVVALLRAVFGRRGGPARRGGLVGLLQTIDAAVRPLRRPVWWNPVLWREVMTRGLGAPVILSRWLLIPVVGFLLAVTCLGGMRDTDVATVFGGGVLAMAVLVSVLAWTVPFTSERTARTLPLLLNTTLWPVRIVVAKLTAAAVTGLPWVLVGFLLLSYGTMGWEVQWGTWRGGGMACGDGLVFAGVPGARVGLVLAWSLAVWFALAAVALAVSMRVRPVRAAFGINLVLVVGFFFVVPFLLEVVGGFGGVGAAMARLWLPFLQQEMLWLYPGCGVPWQFPVATVGWLGVAGAAVGVLSLRLRAWTMRDAGR